MANAAKTQRRTRRGTLPAAILAVLVGCCLPLLAGRGAAAAQLAGVGAAPPVLAPPPPGLSAAMEYRYGEAYDDGAGVPQDFAAAAYWYQSAARRGYPPAQLALARYYWRGVGVPQDLIQGYIWANLAASRMPPGSLDHQAAVDLRDFFRFKLTVPQMAQAQRLATGWPALPPDP